MNDNTTLNEDELYSDLSTNRKRKLANEVIGEHTYGCEGAPLIDDGGETRIDNNAPRIWSPDLHAELFSRQNISVDEIEEFIEWHFNLDQRENEKQRVLRLPSDNEREYGTPWASYCTYRSPNIVGEDRFHQFRAAEDHPDFDVDVEIDYSIGQIDITVTEN